MGNPDESVAVVTGASSGIGAATARGLAAAGYRLFLGARRLDRLAELASALAGEPAGPARAVALPVDVTDPDSVEVFMAKIERQAGRIDVLVNNAGLAHGLEPIDATPDLSWRVMWETNVLGLLRMTRAALPLLRRAPHGHIVNLGSTAGVETYPGGAGYTASKHAVHAISGTLRQELNGEPIRITEVLAGMVETDFSRVRFHGDQARAAAVYAGVEPLTAGDVAECIVFAVTRPAHVDVDEIVLRPVAQAQWGMVARRSSSP
ncbi:MAG: SDR family NAD(P)-dependent oxidoreductase [Candidatus Dormibacteraceae bacterium]